MELQTADENMELPSMKKNIEIYQILNKNILGACQAGTDNSIMNNNNQTLKRQSTTETKEDENSSKRYKLNVITENPQPGISITAENVWSKPLKQLQNQSSSNTKYISSIGYLLDINIKSLFWTISCGVKDESGNYHSSYKTLNSFSKPVCNTINCTSNDIRYSCKTILSVGMCELEMNGETSQRLMLRLDEEQWNLVSQLLLSLGMFKFHRGLISLESTTLQERVLHLLIKTSPRVNNVLVLFQNVPGKYSKSTKAYLRSIDAVDVREFAFPKSNVNKLVFALKDKTKQFLIRGGGLYGRSLELRKLILNNINQLSELQSRLIETKRNPNESVDELQDKIESTSNIIAKLKRSLLSSSSAESNFKKDNFKIKPIFQIT